MESELAKKIYRYYFSVKFYDPEENEQFFIQYFDKHSSSILAFDCRNLVFKKKYYGVKTCNNILKKFVYEE